MRLKYRLCLPGRLETKFRSGLKADLHTTETSVAGISGFTQYLTMSSYTEQYRFNLLRELRIRLKPFSMLWME